MKRILIGFLVLVCLIALPVLSGCQPSDPSQPDNPDTPDNPDQPGPSGSDFSLYDENGTFKYTIIRGEYKKGIVPKAASSLRSALIDKIGQNVEIGTDWVNRGDSVDSFADHWEILIGDTNRPESIAALEEMEDNTYLIRVTGKKILILGVNDKATVLAVEAFMRDYVDHLDQITETLSVVGEYTPDPSDYVLEDHSTGDSVPRLVHTKYETEDVVVADIIPTEDGYAVSGERKGDSAAGIQKALNDCYRNGGGTVYLPAGTYVIGSSITIPPYVTLRGDWQDPDKGTEYGTVIEVWTDSADKNSEGLFMLGGSGGVVGLTVYYHDQSLEAVKPYPFTFYTNGQGDNYMLSTIKNCTVINGYRGIGACCEGAAAHEQLTVENFKGTFLYSGTEVYNQADVGTWQDVTISNKYWKEASAPYMTAPDAAALDAYTKAHTVGLMLGDLEWTEFESLKVSGCKIGIQIVQGKRIQFAGSLYDVTVTDCGVGLQVDDLDPRWGMVIAHSTIEGGIANNAGGRVKLSDVNVTGKTSGDVTVSKDNLSSLSVKYQASYRKPVDKLYVADLPKGLKTDASAALQAILNEAGKTGGVVYVPGGQYRFDNPVTVPAGVELRGSSSVATRDQGSAYAGTLFFVYYGDDAGANPETDQAFITLAGDYAGLNGIRIMYPENGPYDSNLQTTYTVRGTGKGNYIVNAAISASGYGVDFRGCDEHFIKKVTTCCYYNTFLLGGKNGILSGCLQNGTVICRSGAPGRQNWLSEGQIFDDLFNPILRKTSDYIILDGAENELIYNTFCYGCSRLVVCKNGTNVQVVNVGSDNIGSVQTVMEKGSMTVVNAMRYNGSSFEHKGGKLTLINRLTIGDKNEQTYAK